MGSVGRYKRVVDNTMKNEYEHTHSREEIIRKINNQLDKNIEVWSADLDQVEEYEKNLRDLFNGFMEDFREVLEFPETFNVDQNKF